MLRRLVGTTAPLDIMIVQFRNEKVSNHGSIPITIDCNVVAFIVFEEGFHQPIKRTKQIFQWLHHQVRETCSFHLTRHDAGRQRAVRSLYASQAWKKAY
ncbi:hypothetical protein TNCV_4021081 [Trichonephila clavipes]|nr:hypothetical protein TNCV_4021081 [Trichonephila clavipes]